MEQETQDAGTGTPFLSYRVRLWPMLLIGGIATIIVLDASRNIVTSGRDNASAAINTLRSLAFAQDECRRSGLIDVDQDGKGEYGFLAELAGAVGARQRDGRPSETKRVSTPVLSVAFGNVSSAQVRRSGYVFQVFLPGPEGHFVPEADLGGVGKTAPDPDRAEELWCAYAWPSKRDTDAGRVFFVNQSGTILASKNDASGQNYEGERGPEPWAAFRKGSTKTMTSPLARNTEGLDGGVWIVIH